MHLNVDTDKHLAHARILSHWRRTTAHLMSHYYAIDLRMRSSDPRRYKINNLVNAIDGVLAPLISRMDDGSRIQDLEHLVERGAKFGWLLFSQPSLWTFDWRCKTSSLECLECDLVVLPALMQLSDKHGQALKTARTMSEMQIVNCKMLRFGDESGSNSGAV